MKDDWAEFGFHDLTCEVPADWDPTHIEGTYEKGYVRLDDPRAPRLEIRWEQPLRRVSLSRTIDQHIKLVGKEAKQAERELRVQRNLRVASLSFEESECFSYKNHVEAMGLAVRCGVCRRVVLVRVLAGQDKRPLRPLAVRIFQSLCDHPKDGRSRWRLYGFRFDVPERFRLVRESLKTGRLEFEFKHKGSELTLARAALARMVLRDRTLEQWLEQAFPKMFRGFVVERRSEEFRGHPSVLYIGRFKWVRRLAHLMVRPWLLHCRVWHCPASDKIYVLRALGRERDKNALEKCADLVYCH